MQHQSVADLLSRDRLDGFALPRSPNLPNEVLGRYLQNVAVSQALYPVLHTLEVLLRNQLNAAIASDYPIDQDLPNTYREFPCWLDASSSILTSDHQDAVNLAKRGVLKELRRRWGGTAASALRLRTPGRLVAKMNFSFWVFLFDPDYSARGRVSGVLWPKYLQTVFPHLSGGSLNAIRKLLRRQLVLRNRTMHYERILPWSDPDNSAMDPIKAAEDALELIGWMSPAARAVSERHIDWWAFSPEASRYFRLVAWSIETGQPWPQIR